MSRNYFAAPGGSAAAEFGVPDVTGPTQLAAGAPERAFDKEELKKDLGKSPFLNKVNVSLLSFGPRRDRG
eukprot:11243810-Alexandrium_andersonii.AAC.1